MLVNPIPSLKDAAMRISLALFMASLLVASPARSTLIELESGSFSLQLDASIGGGGLVSSSDDFEFVDNFATTTSLSLAANGGAAFAQAQGSWDGSSLIVSGLATYSTSTSQFGLANSQVVVSATFTVGDNPVRFRTLNDFAFDAGPGIVLLESFNSLIDSELGPIFGPFPEDVILGAGRRYSFLGIRYVSSRNTGGAGFESTIASYLGGFVVTAVPAPATLWLLIASLLGLSLSRLRSTGRP